MKFFLIMALLLGVHTPNSFAAKRKYRHTPATVQVLKSCEELPKTCPDTVDHLEVCTATVQKKKVEEGARDSDNGTCMTQRLWKKLCDQGLETDQVKVSCH